MQKTGITWTEYSWNPTTGCELPLASSGCLNCYARELHNKRHKAYLAGKKLPKQYAKPFEEIQLFPERLDEPLRKRKPCKIFVGSMTDLFHPSVPFEFIGAVMLIVAGCSEEAQVRQLVNGPVHLFQVLTKRPERILEFATTYKFPNGKTLSETVLSNLHIGVSAENQEWWNKRKKAFLSIPAAYKFVSNEPLLGEIQYTPDELQQLDGIIIGAESIGSHAGRECKIEWIRDLVGQGKDAGVKVHVKQLYINGKLVKDITKFPKDLQIREE